jgi:hypothetical protein
MTHYSFTTTPTGGAFFYLVFCVAVGLLASSRGRSGTLWFILSLLISPVLALIILLVMRNLKKPNFEDPPDPQTHVKCPECREFILKDARKCKHCGSVISPQI